MTDILLTETTKLVADERSYAPYWYDAGGREYRSLQTGELALSQPKWVHTGTWHDKIESAIMELARHRVISRLEQATLAEFLSAQQAEIKAMMEGLANIESFHVKGVTFKVIEHDS
jgi:hypothetical protein